jgi:phosphoribosyl 1,2-cyclic phosphodiesterase
VSGYGRGCSFPDIGPCRSSKGCAWGTRAIFLAERVNPIRHGASAAESVFELFPQCAQEYLEAMVRMTVLASGSRGNCTVITAGRTRVLVDAGVSCREILRRARAAGEEMETLDAILITHEHQDHVQGLSGVLYGGDAPGVGTLDDAAAEDELRGLAGGAQGRGGAEGGRGGACRRAFWGPGDEPVLPRRRAEGVCRGGSGAGRGAGRAGWGGDFRRGWGGGKARTALGGPLCTACGGVFTIPHDAADPVGFVLEGEGVRIGFATDLGYMPANVAQQLRGCDCMLLESNHDLDMLRDGPYPWSVKQRVLSRVGHLSNAAAAEFLEKGYDGGARYVVLAHLSQSNNLPELARIAAEWALRERMHLLANKVVVAAQEEPTEPIYL